MANNDFKKHPEKMTLVLPQPPPLVKCHFYSSIQKNFLTPSPFYTLSFSYIFWKSSLFMQMQGLLSKLHWYHGICA